MNFEREHEETREQRAMERTQERVEFQDAAIESAIENFRRSVRAWSEAELSHARAVQTAIRHRSWRLAMGWALGCALVMGGASGVLLERRHQAEQARIKTLQDAEHRRQVAAQRVKDADEELAKVNSDVARDVPSAMEPLAQLMGEDESQ